MIGARTIGAAIARSSWPSTWARRARPGRRAAVEHQLIQAMLADTRRDRDEPRARRTRSRGSSTAAPTARRCTPRRRWSSSPRPRRRPHRRPLRADLRRPRLHARAPGRAALSRAARRPDLGGHLRDPAADRRTRSPSAASTACSRSRTGAAVAGPPDAQAAAGLRASSARDEADVLQPVSSRTASPTSPGLKPHDLRAVRVDDVREVRDDVAALLVLDLLGLVRISLRLASSARAVRLVEQRTRGPCPSGSRCTAPRAGCPGGLGR